MEQGDPERRACPCVKCPAVICCGKGTLLLPQFLVLEGGRKAASCPPAPAAFEARGLQWNQTPLPFVAQEVKPWGGVHSKYVNDWADILSSLVNFQGKTTWPNMVLISDNTCATVFALHPFNMQAQSSNAGRLKKCQSMTKWTGPIREQREPMLNLPASFVQCPMSKTSQNVRQMFGGADAVLPWLYIQCIQHVFCPTGKIRQALLETPEPPTLHSKHARFGPFASEPFHMAKAS